MVAAEREHAQGVAQLRRELKVAEAQAQKAARQVEAISSREAQAREQWREEVRGLSERSEAAIGQLREELEALEVANGGLVAQLSAVGAGAERLEQAFFGFSLTRPISPICQSPFFPYLTLKSFFQDAPLPWVDADGAQLGARSERVGGGHVDGCDTHCGGHLSQGGRHARGDGTQLRGLG